MLATAKKIKLTAKTPRGTFTRTSARPYAFVIVSGGYTLDAIRRQVTSRRATEGRNLRWYEQQIAAGAPQFPGQMTMEKVVAGAERARAYLATDAEAEIQSLDTIAATEVRLVGWSQTRQNAEKAAEAARKYNRDVEVFPV